MVDVLPDRSTATMAKWLSDHPTVEVVSRDRCRLYAKAARQGVTHARQVADRFHLVQNLKLAVERQRSRSPQLLRPETSPHRPAFLRRPSIQLENQKRSGEGCRLVWLARFAEVKRLQGDDQGQAAKEFDATADRAERHVRR